MKKLVDEVLVYKVTNNTIKKIKTINVSIREHGYYRTFNAAKKSLINDLNSDIKFSEKWFKEHTKDANKEQNDLKRTQEIKNKVLTMKEF